MATKEIPVDDSEIDALMAELEAESATMVAAPAAPAPAATEPNPAQLAAIQAAEEAQAEEERKQAAAAQAAADLSAAEAAELADLNVEVAPAASAAEPEPTSKAEDVVVSIAASDIDAELAELEAEVTGAATPAATVKAEGTPAATAALDQARAEAAPAIAAAKEEDVVIPNPMPAEAFTPPAPAAAPAPTPTTAPKMANPNPLDVDQFRMDIRVSETNLDNCMMEQAGLRAYYGAQAAQFEAKAGRIKVGFDVLEAQLYESHRKALELAGGKVTEKQVETAVKLDPKWAAGKKAVIDAEGAASVAKSMAFAIAERRDMIIQLGADRRDEYKGQARTMAAEQHNKDVAARALEAGKRGAGA